MNATLGIQTSDEREGLWSASSAERDVNCPGARNLCATIPARKADALAAVGTAIHSAIETQDNSALSEEEIEIVELARETEGETLRAWSEELGSPTEFPNILREQRLWIRDRASLSLLCSAKLDVAYVLKHAALIIDYKTGFKMPPGATKNWQLRVQAVALWHEFPELTNIRVAALQARFGQLSASDYSPDDLHRSEKELTQAVWRSKQPDAARHPGHWCRYCSAQAYCVELQSWSQAGITTVKPATIEMWAQALSPYDLRRIWEKTTIINSATEAVKERLKAMDPEELAAIGLKLKPGKKRIRITDEAEAKLLVRFSQLPLEDIDILACSHLSRTELAEKVAQNSTLSKSKAQAAVDLALAPVLDVTHNSPELDTLA